MAFFSKSSVMDDIPNIPRHVAIIMDGNNRWAKKRLLPGPAGHKAGVEAIRKILTTAEKYGVEAITLFAFSSENWQRPRKEVEALMSLFLAYLEKEVKDLNQSGVRVRVIGDRSRFSDKLLGKIEDAEVLTAANTKTTLSIAADYGGQWDIAQAARKLALEVKAGRLDPESITADTLDQAICLSDLPKPDLCIRTGGDHRISNFLLWQLAYTELYFTDVLWPDFGEAEFVAAMTEFSGRQRRFGKTSEQVEGENLC
jgi:undecaprenyl diphosphate synthase